MKQSRLASFIEQIGNTATGFIIALVVQWVAFPLIYGVKSTHEQDLLIISIFTVASILRGYGWRRLMEALHVRRPLSPFMQAVIAERFRQIEGEGWDLEHDDRHEPGELATAGAAYALHTDPTHIRAGIVERCCPRFWPWSLAWWKPAGFRRDLVKACALIIAEGEKFDRQRKRKDVKPEARAA
jgi:hypothetical protein